MRKAVLAGLTVAALVMIIGLAVSTLTYRHVTELTQHGTGAIEVTLSAREQFFIRFSNFWMRYFIFLTIVSVPVSVGGAMVVGALFSKRKGGAA